jgi:hypothetical protein
VIYRDVTGELGATGSQFWHQDSAVPAPGGGAFAVADSVDSNDQFGSALAGGDFNGDGLRDLAIGVPGEDFFNLQGVGVVDGGAVNVLYYDSVGVGLHPAAGPGNQFWTQESTDILTEILDDAEPGDRFGSALTAWNFGSSSLADLAVGVPFEDVGAIEGAGAVTVIYGDNAVFPSGLTAFGNQFWHQDQPDIEDIAERGDQFGRALY